MTQIESSYHLHIIADFSSSYHRLPIPNIPYSYQIPIILTPLFHYPNTLSSISLRPIPTRSRGAFQNNFQNNQNNFQNDFSQSVPYYKKYPRPIPKEYEGSTEEEKRIAMGKRFCYEYKNRGTCSRGADCWYMHKTEGTYVFTEN